MRLKWKPKKQVVPFGIVLERKPWLSVIWDKFRGCDIIVSDNKLCFSELGRIFNYNKHVTKKLLLWINTAEESHILFKRHEIGELTISFSWIVLCTLSLVTFSEWSCKLSVMAWSTESRTTAYIIDEYDNVI